MKKFVFATLFFISFSVLKAEEEDVTIEAQNHQSGQYEDLKEILLSKLHEIIVKNFLDKIKPERLNALGVNGNVMLETSIVFTLQFLKKYPRFAMRFLVEKIDEISSEEWGGLTVDDVVIFKSFYMCSNENKDVALLLKENNRLLTEKKIFKYAHSLNTRFSLENLYLPYQLFYSYVATNEEKFLERMFDLYLNYEEDELSSIKEKFSNPKVEIEEEYKEEFKKYIFYLQVVKLIKENFELLREGIYKILDNDNINGLQRRNLKNIIQRKEQERWSRYE